MKNIIQKFYIMFLFLFLFLFIIIRPVSAAVNIDECKSCHQVVKPLVVITKDCQVCHEHHGGAPPSTRDITEVHPRHLEVDEGRLDYCKTCHTSPVDCKNCHNSHDINYLILNNLNLNNSLNNLNSNNSNNSLNNLNSNNSNNSLNNLNSNNSNYNQDKITNYSICQNCHGPLPAPYGHADFRDALKISKHNWMNCQTCHIPPFKNNNSVDLHFKDLMGTPIKVSINLCRVCHSAEYKELVQSKHGKINDTCVDCHNPHTTSIGNAKLVVPKAGSSTQVNLTGTIQGATNWLTTKFPILNNSMAIAIILILIAVTVLEYLLSKHDEGKKVAYKMVRIQADENTLKTLEVKLGNQNINLVNEILKENGIDVLGMTMTKQTDLLYDYVIFIDIGKQMIEESEGTKLIEKISREISSLTEVNSVEVTDRYEL